MFTWEEAGLLRQMLLVVKWTAIGSVVVMGACFRQPILKGAGAVYHRVEARMHGRSHLPPSPAETPPR